MIYSMTNPSEVWTSAESYENDSKKDSSESERTPEEKEQYDAQKKEIKDKIEESRDKMNEIEKFLIELEKVKTSPTDISEDEKVLVATRRGYQKEILDGYKNLNNLQLGPVAYEGTRKDTSPESLADTGDSEVEEDFPETREQAKIISMDDYKKKKEQNG